MRPVRPRGLVGRVVALVVLACVVTAGLGFAISVPIVARGADDHARARLADLADLAARTGYRTDRADTRATLRTLRIGLVVIGPDAQPVGRPGRDDAAVTNATVEQVLAGRSVSTTATVDGHATLVEGRPLTGGGGVVLVQRVADASAAGRADLVHTLWALAGAVAVTVALGTLLSRRLLRPLRDTTRAAHDLAGGRRDVHVPEAGPVETRELAVALNTLTDALAHSEGRQREFLLSVSHDLRTPLTAITGYAESLRTGVVSGAVADEFLAGIESEAGRLGHLVDDLLDLARLQADAVRTEPQPVDLAVFAADVRRDWATRCAAAGVRLEVPDATGAPVVQTDPRRVRQVVDLLLDNAVRVVPAGAPVVVEVRPPDPGDAHHAAVLDVRDGGPGLTDDDLAVAFHRGALRDRYAGDRPVGTGLGLALVASVAAVLGATVAAGHAREGGARFTLALPWHAPGRPEPVQAAGPARSFNSPRRRRASSTP